MVLLWSTLLMLTGSGRVHYCWRYIDIVPPSIQQCSPTFNCVLGWFAGSLVELQVYGSIYTNRYCEVSSGWIIGIFVKGILSGWIIGISVKGRLSGWNWNIRQRYSLLVWFILVDKGVIVGKVLFAGLSRYTTSGGSVVIVHFGSRWNPPRICLRL